MQLSQQPDTRELADQIEQSLRSTADLARAIAEKRYLKSDLQFIGAGVPAIRRAATTVKRGHPSLDRAALLDLVQELWRRPVHERRMAAVELLTLYQDRLAPEDLSLVETLLRDARTWALVDPLAITVVGGLVQRFPDLAGALDRWAMDSDFWLRRASLLALLGPLRDGRGDLPATPIACAKSENSLSARQSAGCCASSARHGPIWSTPGWRPVSRAPPVSPCAKP
jgi:3-methyladenine DNA glycosylase AlkD